jgi:hypothetical protein
MLRTSSPLLSVVALMLAAGTLSGCNVMAPTAWVTTEQEVEFDLDGIERFSLLTRSGTIEAVASEVPQDANVARLVVTVKAGGRNDADAQNCLDAIELIVTRQGDSDEVQDIRWEFVKSRRPNWSAQVSYRLELPPTIEVYAKAHNGKLDVRGVSARCELHSHNGAVVVFDAGDDGLVADTHNGKLVVTTSSTNVDLHTHNGGAEVTLTNPSQVSGSVSTHNGSLTVAVDSGSSAQLVCRTHNGRVKSVDIPLRGVTVDKRTRLEGTMGEGGPTLELTTHNGSVTLTSLTDSDIASLR